MTVEEKLKETWDFCLGLYNEQCVALTLHGSQNYNCNLPDSDVDAKLFIVPSWDDVIFYKQPESKTIAGPYGDINVTDIRFFIDNCLKKQNFNFLECLFTKYFFVSNEYIDLWEELISKREEIAHYKPDQAVRTMMGQVENQYGRWGRFDKKKTLYHMMRISWAIESYQLGYSFEIGLVPANLDHIMRVREGNVSEEDMDYMFKMFYEHCHYMNKFQYKGPEYPKIEHFMNHMTARFVYRALS